MEQKIVNAGWKKWYDGLSKREQLHYHYNRRLFFDDGLVERIDKALGYPEWTEPAIQVIHRFGCLLFGHDKTGGEPWQPLSCVYCGKIQS